MARDGSKYASNRRRLVMDTDGDGLVDGPPAGSSWTHELVVADLGTGQYGYYEGTGGDLTPQTNPVNADLIIRFYVDATNALYVYTGTGSYSGTDIWVVIEGFNDDATSVQVWGSVNQWFKTSVTGLQTFLAGEVGNTLNVNIYAADPAP